MGVPRLVALLAAATVAAVAAAMALPAPVTADEVHVRSVSSVRLPLTSSIDINLRVYGAGRGDADGRLRRAREAFEAAVAAVEGLPAGAIARRRNEVSQNSDGRWQGSADYKVDAPAERIFAVLRAADATDQNVVSYVNVDFEVARSANAGGVNAGFRAASDSARLEATAYLDAVGRKLGPLLGTQSYDNSRSLSSYNPLLETTVEAQYSIQLP